MLERTSPKLARAKVLGGDAAAAVILPTGTEAVLQPLSLFNGSQVQVELLYDPSRATEVDILQGLLTQEAMRMLSEELASRAESLQDVPVAVSVIGQAEIEQVCRLNQIDIP